MVERLRQLLHRVVERLGVRALELQYCEQRRIPFGVLLLTVLHLVSVDGPLSAQRRIDVSLLGRCVGDVQCGERPAYRVAIGGAVPQFAKQTLEPSVVLKDQLHHVSGDGSAKIKRSRRHGSTLSPWARRLQAPANVARWVSAGPSSSRSGTLRCPT